MPVLFLFTISVIVYSLRCVTNPICYSISVENTTYLIVLLSCSGFLLLSTLVLSFYDVYLRYCDIKLGQITTLNQSLSRVILYTVLKLLVVIGSYLRISYYYSLQLNLIYVAIILSSCMCSSPFRNHRGTFLFLMEGLCETLPLNVSIFSTLVAFFGHPSFGINLLLQLLGFQISLVYAFGWFRQKQQNIEPIMYEKTRQLGELRAGVLRVLNLIETGTPEDKLAFALNMERSHLKQGKMPIIHNAIKSDSNILKYADAGLKSGLRDRPLDHLIDDCLYGELEDFLRYAIKNNPMINYEIKFLYITLMHSKRDKKIKSIRCFFEFSQFDNRTNNWADWQAQYNLQKFIQKEIKRDYKACSGSINEKFEKAFKLDRLSLRLTEAIKEACTTMHQMWFKLQYSELSLSFLLSQSDQLYEANVKVEHLFKILIRHYHPTQLITKMYLSFTKHIMHDFEKANFYREKLDSIARKRVLYLMEIDLDVTKVTTSTFSSFFLISGDACRYGQITYASKEVKQVLGYENDSCINKNIGKLKPPAMEHYYKNLIQSFYDKDSVYTNITLCKQFYDVFVDQDQFIMLFLTNIRIITGFGEGTVFAVFLTPVQASKSQTGLVLCDKSLGNIVGFNRYMNAQFQLNPKMLEVDQFNETHVFTVATLFKGLPSADSLENVREGTKHVIKFSPIKTILRLQHETQLKFSKSDQSVVDPKEASWNNLKTDKIGIGQDAVNNSLNVLQQIFSNDLSAQNTTYEIEVQIMKTFRYDNDQYLVLSVIDQRDKNFEESFSHSEEEKAERTGQVKSTTKAPTFLSTRANLDYQNDPKSTKQKFKTYSVKTSSLIFGFSTLQLLSMLAAVLLFVNYLDENLDLLTMIKVESQQQQLLVQSYLNMQIATAMRRQNSPSADLQPLIDDTSALIHRFITINRQFFESLAEFTQPDPEIWVGVDLEGPRFQAFKAQTLSYVYVNVTDQLLKYSLDPFVQFQKTILSIEACIKHNDEVACLVIEENFTSMIVYLRFLILGLFKGIMDSFGSTRNNIYISISACCVLIAIEVVVFIPLVRSFDKRANKVYEIFLNISQREARYLAITVDKFAYRFFFSRQPNVKGELENQSSNDNSPNTPNTPKPFASSFVDVQHRSVVHTFGENPNGHNSLMMVSCLERSPKNSDSRIHNINRGDYVDTPPPSMNFYASCQKMAKMACHLLLPIVAASVFLVLFRSSFCRINTIINDNLEMTNIAHNLNLIKMLQTKLFYQPDCIDCKASLIPITSDTISKATLLQSSIRSYDDSHLMPIQAFDSQVSRSYCESFINPHSERLAKYRTICSGDVNLNSNLLISLSQTFQTFLQLTDPNSTSYQETDLWDKVSLALNSFSLLFALEGDLLEDAFISLYKDQTFLFVMFYPTIMVSALIICYLSCINLQKRWDRKITVRSQIIRLLRSDVLAYNPHIKKHFSTENDPSN